MGSTNFTPHYDIPLPLGSDKTTPMDYNTSMQAVDTALFEAQGNASDAKQSVTTLTQDLAQTNDNVSALAGRVTTAEGTITSQGTAITNLGTRVDGVEADAQDMICAYKEASATASRNYAIGDYFIYNDVLYRATQTINSGNTIVPDTNCTTTNVTSEIKNIGGDLSAYQTKQDNALTTSSKQVVGAINELKSNLSVKKIAEAPANQTFATQLQYLETYFNNLSSEDKMRSALALPVGGLYKVTNQVSGLFGLTSLASSKYVIEMFRIDNHTYLSCVNGTVTDASSSINTGKLELWVI